MTTDQWGKGRYLKKEVERALSRETELHGKVHKFVVMPEKALRLNKKDGLNRDPKTWGEWVKRDDRKEVLKEFLKIKKQNAKYYT